MNCEQALALIDVRGLRELTSKQLAELERHAHECETCGPALDAARALETRLRRLSEPRPPEGMAAAVLARVSDADSRTEAARPGDAGAWAALAAGLALAVGAHAYRLWVGEAMVPLSSSLLWTWIEDLRSLPSPSPAVVAFVAGVVLSVAGLGGLFRDAPSSDPSYFR